MRPALLVLLVCLCRAESRQYTLNVPRVLLPLVPSSGTKTNFTLKSQHGCFEWMSTKPDIATVEPLYEVNEKTGERCSREAVLTSQSTHPAKLSTIIVAKELATGQVLRCDIFVDTISRIAITTRTRELLLEEEPERFEIQAFDDEGNMFSTIRGHVIDWTLLPDEEATYQQPEPESILTFVDFEDSSYSTDPVIGQLEEKGLHGDILLVSGLSTGTAKVQARLVDRVWKGVSPDIVKLLVVENIMLQPSTDVYILPLSFIDYHVERKKYGRTDRVPMPSDQYRLEVTNATVGRLDTQRSRVTGLIVGYTEVVLQDKNMLHTPSATKPTAGVHVVPPHHLGFSIAPGNVWVLEVGREYGITVHIYDRLNHRMVVTENVRLETLLPAKFLHSHFSSVNGSYHHVRASKPGSTTLHSTLKKIKHPDTGELHDVPVVISRQQPLEIYEPVLVEPKQLAILWDPASEYHPQHLLQARGGSGGYVWSCDPERVVHVSNAGIVTAIARGRTVVKAADSKNTAHFDTAEVLVVPPAEMSFLTSRVEAVLGSSLLLPVQIRGFIDEAHSTALPFSNCRQLKMSHTFSDESIFNITENKDNIAVALQSGACTFITALAVKPGHTRLTISYKHADISLEASITIAAYPPLIPVDPATIAVVTLGSSKDYVFEGGPAPWVLDRSKYEEKLIAEKPSEIAVHPKATGHVSSPQHIYRVVCRQLGEQVITITVGNKPTLKNPFPAKENTSSRISCALPVSMVINPVVSHMPDCPLLEGNQRNLQFPVLGGRQLDLDVMVFDAESRPFDNFTSLQWQWGSSDEKLLPTPTITSLTHHGVGAIMTVQLSQQSGSVILTASSSSHIQKYLIAEKINFKDPFSPGVNYSITLLLRTGPEIAPSSLLLFNHPDNTATLNIIHGSGHFRVDHVIKTHPLPVATVTYLPDLRQISLVPLGEGQVHITVNDLCLEADMQKTATVFVSGLYSIHVAVADKVQVGSWVLAFVKVFDNRDSPFTAAQLRHMHLQANPKSAHINLKPAGSDILSTLAKDKISHSAVFVVTGTSVGTTHLAFNATTVMGRVVQSLPKEIQVFDALKLLPKYITLLPTATFQIRSTGGPMPLTSIAYSINNATVASVNEVGLIEALEPGTATVTGKAQAEDPVHGHLTTYSEDVVYVTVLRLTGIKLYVPSTKLLSGVEVAVYADGMNDDTPFSFASVTPGISFHWSATNMDVLSLASVYDKAGVSLQEEQDFAARLRTRNPGQGTVRLTAKCPRGVCVPDGATFTDQVQVEVLHPLRLLRPINGRLLLPHHGRTQIVTNRDGSSRMSYQLMQTVSDCSDQQDWITITSHGEIETNSVNGHAVVMVTSHEEDLGLNQTVMVHVEVRPIASLSIAPVSLAQATPNSRFHAFPLGYSAEFIAYLHDGIGRVFDFAEISLSNRLNRFDIVGISPGTANNTFIVKAAKQGDIIFNVWVTSLPHVTDYIRIRVQYAILPSLAVVHLGSTICFATHLSENWLESGRWTTGDEGVIVINSDSGVATALSTGRAVVYHKNKDYVDTHTEITITKVSEVVFSLTENLPTFTNAQRKSEFGPYRISVQFLHASGGGGEFSLLQLSTNRACSEEVNASRGDVYIQQVPFVCVLELVDDRTMLQSDRFISALAQFDGATGQSYCELVPVEDYHSVDALSIRDSISLSLYIKAFDSTHTYEVYSSKVSVPFVSAFSISRSSVVLTSAVTSAEITVNGLTKQLHSLQVTSPYPFAVAQVTASATTATYRISLVDYYSPPQENYTDIQVTFSSSLTDQESYVNVSYFTELTESSDACVSPQTPEREDGISSLPSRKPQPSTFLMSLDDTTMYIVVAVLTILAVCIGGIVICLAISRGSTKPQGGFRAHLHHTPQQAFSAHSMSGFQTPSIQRSSPVAGQSGGSAFKRPGSSPSPQHGLFSQ